MKKLNSSGVIRKTLFAIETLEQRILLSADPIVSELVQQYYNANAENSGALRVAQSTTSENVLLKQTAQENASLNRLDLNLANVKNQNFALNSIDIKNFDDFQNTAGQIVIGNENSHAIVTLGDAKTDTGKLAFNQNLLISNPQNGGEIFIDDDLVGGKNADLTIHGSGHTTTLSADILTAAGSNITINDSLKISGARLINSGSSIQLGSSSNHFLDGNSTTGNTLTLEAAPNTGNIVVEGIVGGDSTNKLSALTITGNTASNTPSTSTKVNDVVFNSAVTIAGDVIIEASGTVTFSDTLTITGNLTITGAKSVVFGNRVIVSGTTTGTITLTGGSGLTDSVIFNNDVSSKAVTITGFETVAFKNNLTVSSGNLSISNAAFATTASFGSNVVVSAGSISITDSTITNTTDNATFYGDVTASAGITISKIETVVFKTTLNISAGNLSITDAKSTAFGSNVVVSAGTISVVDSLTIGSANFGSDNLTFNSDVTTSGNVTITAIETVAFNAALNISAGDLSVTAAKLAVFGNNLVMSGSGKNILLESDEITLNGGQESVRGTGTLTMYPTTKTYDIAIASPPAENTDNTLNLSSSELVTLKAGFSKITIGREDTATAHADLLATGTIYIGSKAANQNTFTDPLVIFGKNIEIKDYSNPDFKFQNKDTIKLDAVENILIYNEVKAIDGTTNKNITLYSAAGEIKQVSNDTDALVTESIGAGDLTITSSKGIDLSWVNAVNVAATNTTSGNIKINSNAPIAVTTTFTTMTGVPTSNILLSSDTNNLIFNVPLTTTSGSITVNSGGTLIINNPISTTSGTIDIKSKNDLTLNAITSSTGSSPISFTSTAASIFQKADITSATAGGLITLTAAVNIDMLDGKKISTGSAVSGTITLTAGADIKVSILEATTAINVTSTAGAIVDNLTGETATDLNIKGSTTVATLKAAKGIGTAIDDMDTLISTLSASNDLTAGATGGIFISEIDALTIGAGGIKSSGGDGSVVILTTGLLTIAGSIDVSGAVGNILLKNASSDILLNALVKSASGNISMITLAGSIIHSAAGDIEIGTDVTKTIELESSLAITMVDGAVIKTKGGNVYLNAKGGNIQIGSIDAVTGSVSILTTNIFSIFDVEGTDSDTDITAENCRIATKSLGTTTNALDLNVTNLSVATVNGLFLSEGNGVIVKEIPIVRVNRVGIAAATTALADSAVQSGLQSTTSGAIVLTTVLGDITLDKSVIAGGVQNVLINAKGDLKINAVVNVSSGSLNLISGATLTQTADGDILTAGGTLDVNAATTIFMADGAETKTTDKDIRYKTTTGDISLGFIDAGTGSVAILAGGNIVDSESTIAVPAVDIKAKALNLTAGNGVTTAENPLEINVDNLTATTSGVGGIFLLESNAISVEQVSVTVNLVSTAGANSADTPIIASDLATSNGSIILNAADITLKDSNSNNKVVSAIGSGNILLNANNGNLIFDSSINTGSGNISLVATGNIVASSTSQILTNSLGTIDLMATSGINMMNGAKIQTSNTNIRLNASTGDITIGQINAGTANVSLITGGQIFDGNDTGIDVVAGGLRLNAMTGVGKSDNALDINVITLSGMVSNGSFFISDATGITVTTIDALSVNRVDNKAAVTPVIDAAQSDLISAANGSIILTALAGDIIILDGNTDGKSLFTTSTGNILLNAVGGISVQADINANGGNITLLSSASIIQGSVGNIVTVGKGTIDLSAAVAINVAIGAKIQTAGGNIRLNAVESMTLSGVNAVTGSVSLSANSILGSNSDNVLDIVATNLRINAISAGTGTNALDINVDNLTAVMTNGGLFINEANGITVTEIPAIVVNRVAATGLIADITDLKQSNLSSLAGAIVLTTQAGDITVLDGNSDTKGITTQSGNILLNAAANLNIQSAIENVSGNISLISGAMLSQSATGNLTTVNSGTIDVTAATILMANGSTTKTADTNIRYTSTGGDITVGILNAGKANIALFAAKNIVDANTTATDIFASGVNFVAAGIGSVTNPLEIAASKLTANASASGMFITDTDAVSVEKVNIAVFKVDLTGIATASEIVTGSDLKTIMGAILLNAPKITITDGNNDNKGVTSTSGDISLNATADALELQSSVSSGSGNLVLSSSAALKQGATGHIFTSEAGSINLTAGAELSLTNGAKIQATTGKITIKVIGAATLNNVSTTVGTISLNASKITIMDGNNNQGVTSTSGNISLNTTAGTLELQSSVSSGSGNLVLSASAALKQGATGHIFTSEAGSINLTAGAELSLTNGAKIQATTGKITIKVIGAATLNNVSTTVGTISLNASKITIMDGNNNQGVTSTSGNISLNTTAGTLELQSSVSSGSGNLVLSASAALKQGATGHIITSATGNIDVTAGAEFSLTNGAKIQATTGKITIKAIGTITLNNVSTTVGTISLNAPKITITDGNNDNKGVASTSGNISLNTTAGTLELQSSVSSGSGNLVLSSSAALKQGATGHIITSATGNIDVTAGAEFSLTNGAKIQATTGKITIKAIGAATLNNVSTTVGTISLNASKITITDGNNNQGVTSTSGNISLNATAGSLELQSSVSSGSGNLVLSSSAALKQGATGHIVTSVTGNIDVTAGAEFSLTNGAKIQATTGKITIKAIGTITLNNVSTTVGTISLNAPKITIIDSDNSKGVTSTSGDISLNATAGALELQSSVSSSSGNIQLKAKANLLLKIVSTTGNVSLSADKILDGNSKGNIITADGLRINANGFGLNNNPINTDINNLSARVSTGGLFITEAKNLTLTEIPQILTDTKQSDVVSAGGSVVIILTSGNLNLTDGNDDKKSIVLTGKGNLLLESKTGNLDVQAGINSEGSVSLQGATITQGTVGSINTTTKNTTIDLNADTAFTMAEGAKIQTVGGNIRLNVTSGIMTLAEVNSGNGNVSLTAKSIISNGSKVNNVTAANLRLNANGVGSSTKTLDTNVEKISAMVAEGGFFVSEANNLIVGETPKMTVNRVNAKGEVGKMTDGQVTDSKQSDVVSSKNGSVVLSALGDITITKGSGFNNGLKTDGTGNTLIESRGGFIDIQATVSNGSGALSLIAEKEIKLSLSGQVSGQGSIDMSSNKNVLMSDGTKIIAQNNAIRISAKEKAQISGINANSVSLLANSIADAGDSKADITATNLRINAVNGVGTRLNSMDLDVATFSAAVGKDGLFVRELNAINLAQTPEMTVNRVSISGEITKITDSKQSNVSSLDNGAISVIAENNITINDKIISNRSGDILIQSTKGSIFQNATIESTGKIQLRAAQKVVNSSQHLAQIITATHPISDYGIQPKNEPFYFWTENIQL